MHFCLIFPYIFYFIVLDFEIWKSIQGTYFYFQRLLLKGHIFYNEGGNILFLQQEAAYFLPLWVQVVPVTDLAKEIQYN